MIEETIDTITTIKNFISLAMSVNSVAKHKNGQALFFWLCPEIK